MMYHLSERMEDVDGELLNIIVWLHLVVLKVEVKI